MYYGSGNYESFARPRKPEGIEEKSAWIVGGGLAGLATAAFLVRDAQMPGQNITILEEQGIPGGALDGMKIPEKGFVIRGGREMESNFECLWDLFHSVPSLEEENASVLDEFVWLNKRDPNFSLQRATVNCGQDAKTGMDFTLSEKAQKEMISLFLARREDVENKRINEVRWPEPVVMHPYESAMADLTFAHDSGSARTSSRATSGCTGEPLPGMHPVAWPLRLLSRILPRRSESTVCRRARTGN